MFGTPIALFCSATRIRKGFAAMLDRRTLASSLGRVGAAIFVALLALNVFAITVQFDMKPGAAMAAAPMVELA
jgi:hypothetical protein